MNEASKSSTGGGGGGGGAGASGSSISQNPTGQKRSASNAFTQAAGSVGEQEPRTKRRTGGRTASLMARYAIEEACFWLK